MNQTELPALSPTSTAIAQAVETEGLLLAHYDRLLRFIERQLPRELRSLCGPEDILQETYTQAFLHIGQFQPAGDDAFYRWLATIARNKIIDFVHAQKRAKRGGGRMRVALQQHGSSTGSRAFSYDGLLSEIAVTRSTPSRGAARDEAVAALHVALAQLPDPMRQAVTLRYVQGQSVAQTAQTMGRTGPAVHKLCYRALRNMRASMGRASSYLSSTG